MDLKNRIKKFKDVEYKANEDLYRNLENMQEPHTLFISCSDSRIDAETLLQAGPGEVFQMRNVANLVPREAGDLGQDSVISAIEYAVCVLKVKM